MVQSRNGFLAFLVELAVIAFCWSILAIVAQNCMLADIFGNNVIFDATNAITTYMMHVILAKIAITLVMSQFFQRSNTIYVGLSPMTHADIRELFIVVHAAVMFVTVF